MQKAVQRVHTTRSSPPEKLSPRRLAWPRFFLRYPIFILAFGPPLFRATDKYAGADTAKAHFDIWTILQLGLVAIISSRAFLNLVNANAVRIIAPVRSIVKYWCFLGLVFAISVAYSPGRVVSFAYALIYFLILISIVDFLVDTYRRAPDWMQCLFALRLVSLLLFFAVLVTLVVHPMFVLSGPRLLGGSIASMALICPVITIISAYSFLHFLEPRWRAALLTFVGIGGTVATQWRGAEIGLVVVLLVLGLLWARQNRRSAYTFVAVSVALSLIVVIAISAFGVDKVWDRFNRGLGSQNVLTFSGRTELWSAVISYCTTHPQGMGYISGIRSSRISTGGTANLHTYLTHMGGADNSYFEILADAGWVALFLYLAIILKILLLGKRFAVGLSSHPHGETVHCRAIQCALLILGFCLIDGIDSSMFATPMSQGYYFQHIAMAIILGATTSIILARRRSAADVPNQLGRQIPLRRQNNLSNL